MIPPEYSGITYIHHGLYRCAKELYDYSNRSNRFESVPDFVIKDRDGKEIPLPCPAKCRVTNLVVFDEYEADDTPIKVLPETTLIEVHGEKGFGIIDGEGKILLKPEYAEVQFVDKNRATVTITDTAHKVRQEIVALKTKSQLPQGVGTHESYKRFAGHGLNSESPATLERRRNAIAKLPANSSVQKADEAGIICLVDQGKASKDPLRDKTLLFADTYGNVIKSIPCHELENDRIFSHGIAVVVDRRSKKVKVTATYDATVKPEAIIDENGNWLTKPEACNLNIVDGDRIIKSTYDSQFRKELWSLKNNDRISQFNNFLLAHNLIGMTRAEVVKALGDGDGKPDPGKIIFSLSGWGTNCGNAGSDLHIDFANDRVKDWCIMTFYPQTRCQLQTKNVIFDRELEEYREKESHWF